jgi:formate dehydrogenase major subunit
MSTPAPNRRDFLRGSTGGFALGSLLGLDLRAARAQTSRFKFADTREFPSVCPYCAVGCGQLVAVRAAGS